MKKISANLYFTVLWRGLCQALGWFFGLFGYKINGKYATCIWRMFATSAAIIVTFMAVMLVLTIGETVYEKYYKEAHCYDPDCYHSEYISENVYYHDLDDGKGYVFNSLTGDKTIRNIKWIAKPENEDSLICFNDGKKRGYFSKYTGKVNPSMVMPGFSLRGWPALRKVATSSSSMVLVRWLSIRRWPMYPTWMVICFMKVVVLCAAMTKNTMV